MNTTSESYDSYRIYIWMMGTLCALTCVWLVYNRYVLVSYENAIVTGLRDYKKIIDLEELVPEGNKQVQVDETPAVIENPRTFFKRKVPNIVPEVAEGPEKEKGNIGDAAFDDYIYTVEFKSINREKLARYIFYIEQEALLLNVKLKLKNMEAVKVETNQSYEDFWRVRLQFVDRRG